MCKDIAIERGRLYRAQAASHSLPDTRPPSNGISSTMDRNLVPYACSRFDWPVEEGGNSLVALNQRENNKNFVVVVAEHFFLYLQQLAYRILLEFDSALAIEVMTKATSPERRKDTGGPCEASLRSTHLNARST